MDTSKLSMINTLLQTNTSAAVDSIEANVFNLQDFGQLISIYAREQDIDLSVSGMTLESAAMKYTLRELHIYGSSRLGISKPDSTYCEYSLDHYYNAWTTTWEPVAFNNQCNPASPPAYFELSRTRGKRFYELTNHLGNVLVTITDRKIPFGDTIQAIDTVLYYTADVLSATDYYPFGSPMPGRSLEGDGYRFGFNGKEKDDEVKGDGNSLDFGARIYDSRLGRWLSVDPLVAKYPYLSPYVAFNNNPILFVDEGGKDNVIYFVVLQSTYESLSVSDVNTIINKVNEYLELLGLDTRAVIFEPYIATDFDFNRIDDNDGVVILGKANEVKEFLGNNNTIKDFDKDWTGGENNPERTSSDDNKKIVRLDASSFCERMVLTGFVSFLTLHGLGHTTEGIFKSDARISNDGHLDSEEHYPNIMVSGDKFNRANSLKVEDFIKNNNKLFIDQMKETYQKGENKRDAKVNYHEK